MDADTDMICPECFCTMHILLALANPLYRCAECGLEQYADAITAYWNAELDHALHGDTSAVTFLLVPAQLAPEEG